MPDGTKHDGTKHDGARGGATPERSPLDDPVESSGMPVSVPCPFCDSEDSDPFATFGGAGLDGPVLLQRLPNRVRGREVALSG